MSAVGSAAVFVLPALLGLLGAALSLLSEALIARFLPRLGALPGIRTRFTTAAVTGVLCAAIAVGMGMDWVLPAFMVFSVLAVQLSRIDFTLHLLPNPLVAALLLSGLALFATGSFVAEDWGPFARSVAGAGILFLIYLVLALISPGGIGLGDVKLAGPAGLYLGHLGWSQLFYGGAAGFVLGGLAAALTVALRRRNVEARAKAEVAFGPSMMTAVLVSAFSTF